MDIPAFLERSVPLLGEETLRRWNAKTIWVIGLGGVGGHAAETLARCGVNLILQDGDKISLSNCNRQLFATQENVGCFKAQEAEKRCRNINPEGKFTARCAFIAAETAAAELNTLQVDGVLDAIDDVPAKTALLEACFRKKIPVVSSMGAGGKLDLQQIQAADIARTCGCPLAKRMRKELRAKGIDKGITVIFSPETRQTIQDAEPGNFGTAPWITAAFGLFAASELLKQL